MTKNTETRLAEQDTRLALVEQRTTAIEMYHTRIEAKLDRLIDKLDNQVVTKKEHEADMKNIKADYDSICKRLKDIEENMVSQDDMKSYTRSQFWQKVMTAIGTMFFTIMGGIILWELTRK